MKQRLTDILIWCACTGVVAAPGLIVYGVFNIVFKVVSGEYPKEETAEMIVYVVVGCAIGFWSVWIVSRR